jgi:hypothetical protein
LARPVVIPLHVLAEAAQKKLSKIAWHSAMTRKEKGCLSVFFMVPSGHIACG